MRVMLLIFCTVVFSLFGLNQVHSQPITGTGPDKLMWKQLALDALDVAEAIRSGDYGPDWRGAMREVAQVHPVLFWAVVDYTKGFSPEDPDATKALEELCEALQELYELVNPVVPPH